MVSVSADCLPLQRTLAQFLAPTLGFLQPAVMLVQGTPPPFHFFVCDIGDGVRALLVAWAGA